MLYCDGLLKVSEKTVRHATPAYHAVTKRIEMFTFGTEKSQTGNLVVQSVFHLIDSWQERDEDREVYKYRLVGVEGDEWFDSPPGQNIQRRRMIPTSVKLAVWKRDGGKCDMWRNGRTSLRSRPTVVKGRHVDNRRERSIVLRSPES